MTNEMTNEEAIELLKEKRMEINYQVNGTTQFSKALDMGIKALEQQPITWIVGKDNAQVAVRNMPIDKMQKICAIIGEEEQQPCEDTVSRESVIEWLKDKDIIKMKNQEENARRELAELPSVTPSYNSIKSELDHVIDEIIIRIEQTRDKDKLCEYPYNRCINIIREKIKNVN